MTAARATLIAQYTDLSTKELSEVLGACDAMAIEISDRRAAAYMVLDERCPAPCC
jgi:hypothetical protein